MVTLKLFDKVKTNNKVGYIKVEEWSGNLIQVGIVDPCDGKIMKYLFMITPEGIVLNSCAENDFVKTDSNGYVIVKKD